MAMSSTNSDAGNNPPPWPLPPGQPESFCYAESLRWPRCRHPPLICGTGTSARACPEKVARLFRDTLQLFDFERILIDQMIPFDRDAL